MTEDLGARRERGDLGNLSAKVQLPGLVSLLDRSITISELDTSGFRNSLNLSEAQFHTSGRAPARGLLPASGKPDGQPHYQAQVFKRTLIRWG